LAVLGLSLLAAGVSRWLWPTRSLYDDGAIVLRYMDNFAQGGFSQYNLDGPSVFGISGFLHGVLAGGIASTQILSPQESVLLANMIGVALVSKLDAVPVICVLAAMRTLELHIRRVDGRAWLAELRRAALWAGIPVALFVLTTVIVFGSPLPQSAYAKYFFQPRPDGMLNFVRHWWRHDATAISIQGGGLLCLPLLLAGLRRGDRLVIVSWALPDRSFQDALGYDLEASFYGR